MQEMMPLCPPDFLPTKELLHAHDVDSERNLCLTVGRNGCALSSWLGEVENGDRLGPSCEDSLAVNAERQGVCGNHLILEFSSTNTMSARLLLNR